MSDSLLVKVEHALTVLEQFGENLVKSMEAKYGHVVASQVGKLADQAKQDAADDLHSVAGDAETALSAELPAAPADPTTPPTDEGTEQAPPAPAADAATPEGQGDGSAPPVIGEPAAAPVTG